MNTSVPLSPAMCRRDLLSEDQFFDLDDLLSQASGCGLAAITLPFLYNGDTLYALAAMSFVMRDGESYRHQSVTQTGLPPDLDAKARDLALRLLDTHGVCSDLEEVDADYLVFQADGTFCLTFFPGCAILYPDDPAGRLQGDAYEIATHPDRIGNRAQICTLILNDVASNHERAAQPPKVLRALDAWRRMHGLDSHSMMQKTGVRLASPTQMEIMSCNQDYIGRT